MINIHLSTLDGLTYECGLFPYDTLREEIKKIQPVQPKNTIMLLFYKGKQIQPDLTAAALGLQDGDGVTLYNKIIKRGIPLPYIKPCFPKRTKDNDIYDEEVKLLDQYFNTIESLGGSKTLLKTVYEKQKQRDLEEECFDAAEPKTVIDHSNFIQTNPLPVCFEMECAEFEREFGIPETNLSPLNPLRRNFIQDSQTH